MLYIIITTIATIILSTFSDYPPPGGEILRFEIMKTDRSNSNLHDNNDNDINR